MIRTFTASRGVSAPGLVLALAAGALAIGLAVPYQPALVAAVIAGAAAFLLSIRYPDGMSLVLLALSTISLQYLFEFEVAGLDLVSFYKLGILLLCLPAIMKYGVYGRYAWPVYALMAMVFTTYAFADLHPLLEAATPLTNFIGLAVPFVFLLIRWPRATTEKHVTLIAFMPLISVAFGALFQAGGLTTLIVNEFNGAFRLQGANIPAHLAFLAYIAFMVCVAEIKRTPERIGFYYVMMSVNLLILLLTGTRGPLVAAMLMVLVFVLDLTKQFMRGKAALIVPLAGFVTVLGTAVMLQLDNFRKRSFERTDGGMIDTSGRFEAWEFFLDGVRQSPWFGRGLGSVLVSNDGSIYAGFVVPHNEYIRFYYDGGIVGAVLLFGALFYVLRLVYTRTRDDVKPYAAAFMLGFVLYSITDNTLSTLQFIVPFCVYMNALQTNDDPEKGRLGYGENDVIRYRLR